MQQIGQAQVSEQTTFKTAFVSTMRWFGWRSPSKGYVHRAQLLAPDAVQRELLTLARMCTDTTSKTQYAPAHLARKIISVNYVQSMFTTEEILAKRQADRRHTVEVARLTSRGEGSFERLFASRRFEAAEAAS